MQVKPFFWPYKMHYYQIHIGDFRAGTHNMTREERWLYRDMLDVYYDIEKPLPDNLKAICKAIGVRSERERDMVAEILLLKFTLTDQGYVNDRCEREISEYHKRAEVARLNGKSGGRPPKGSEKKPSGFPAGSHPVASGNPVATQSQANHKPITNNQEPETKKVKPDAPPDGEAAIIRIDVEAVFSYWQLARGHERAKLDDKRAKAIRARLKDGYSIEDLCRAVDGIARSAHHMGQNDQRTVYDDIELICRSAANVDKFARLVGAAPRIDAGLQRQVDILQTWMEQE